MLWFKKIFAILNLILFDIKLRVKRNKNEPIT